jgi:hypothetical protein
MAELTLVSRQQRLLRPLVEAALQNELRLVEAGIRRTQQRLRAFEAQYGLSTAEFLRRYESDVLQENLDLSEWVGEYRMLERLQNKATTLREIQFAN